MKKLLLTIAGVALLGSAWAIGERTAGEVSDNTGAAYGFLIADDGGRDVGFYSFPLSDAKDPVLIGKSARVSAGTMASGQYYAQTYKSGTAMAPVAWNTVDVTTGELSAKADAADDTPLYVDLTYDYTGDRLLGIYHYAGNSTKLAQVNPEDGSAVEILDMPQMWMLTLAATFDGDLYMIGRGMTTTNYLYHIDARNNVEQVAQVEYTGDYLQSMAFDHNTGKLYWASTTDYGSYFYQVNYTDGTCTTVSKLAADGELTGLFVPFAMAQDGTPAAVENLTIANPAHDNNVEISFTVPTLTVDGKEAADITGWTISCDGTEMDIPFTSASAGETVKVNAEALTGLHVFKVELSNATGKGAPAVRKLFVGVDVPAAPKNVTVEVDGSHASIKWDAVSEGAMGGWIDASSVTYNVVRKPDDKVVGQDLTVTAAGDDVEEMNAYQYVVTAISGGNEGDMGASELVAVGEGMELPYECDFTRIQDMVLWTVNDVDADGYTWQPANYYGKPAIMARSTYSYACDEWLVSPALKLEAGKEYKLSYDAGAMNPYYPPVYTVMMGAGPEPEDLTSELFHGSVDKSFPTHSIIYLPKVETTGTYHIGVHAKWDKGNPGLYLGNVKVEENHASRLTLTVVDDQEQHLEGVSVVFGPKKDVYSTDKEGSVKIIEIEPGDYDVKVEKFGYTSQALTYSFAANEDRKETVTLETIPVTSVSGSVKYASGHPTGEASVFVCGYDVYTADVAADGSFRIDNVYATGDYTVEVHAINYRPAVVDVKAIGTAPVELGEITLEEKLTAPANVKGQVSRSKVELSWDAPVDRERTFRYDDGNVGMINSYDMSPQVCDNTVTGTVYDTPGVYTGMSFKADNYKDVRIIVFDMNEDGEPTGKVLYEQTVQGDNWYWVDVTFSRPVVAPRGAFFALAGDSRLYFDGNTDGTRNEEYPVLHNKMWLSYDYTALDEMPFHWMMTDDPYPLFNYNFCLRVTGRELGAPRSKAPRMEETPASAKGYHVWRIPEGAEAKQAQWVQLTDVPAGEATFTDNTWNEAPKGMYRYAVKAVYEGDEVSYAALSDPMPRLMTSRADITLLSNAPGETTAGAAALLVEKAPGTHSYSGLADEDGLIAFDNVWEGEYTLTVTCEGFATLTEDLTVSGQEDFTATYTMKENQPVPFNLVAEETDRGDAWLLRWNFRNFIFDDFENYDDFTVNPAGEIEWTYVDADDLEVAINNDPLPDGDKAAFVVLNPATSENERYTVPHSGEKAIFSLAARYVYDPVDDYIISPELSFKNDFVVNFWAYTYWKGDDYFRVGYSTTGTALEDFTWYDKVMMEEEKWMNPTFDIPAQARYVAINYGGTKRVGGIDDIYIGPADQVPGVTASPALRVPGKAIKYEVYLDGNKVNETHETEYLLENLTVGAHTAGVKSVYASGASEMAHVDIKVLTSGITEVLEQGYTVTAENGKITIDGIAVDDAVAVFDMAGHSCPVVVSGDRASASVSGQAVYVVRINGHAFTVVVR